MRICFCKIFVCAVKFSQVRFCKNFKVCTHNNRHKWVSKGRKSPFGTRFCGTQSLVCYTFVPSAMKRMSVSLHDSKLFSDAEQTEKFREKQKKFVFLTARKRNKRYIKIPVATENYLQLSQRSSLKKYIFCR